MLLEFLRQIQEQKREEEVKEAMTDIKSELAPISQLKA